MKKIVGISGSPIKFGNNERIIKEVLEKFKQMDYDIEQINLSEKKVNPCVACNYCKENPICYQRTDNGNEINKILEKADAIIISTPVYFGSMSGQTKCLLDRTLPLRRNGFKLKGKVGAAIAIGGARNGGQELTIKDIHAWMLIHGMIIVGDDNHFGGILHAPMDEDHAGKKTAEEMVIAVHNLLKRLK